MDGGKYFDLFFSSEEGVYDSAGQKGQKVDKKMRKRTKSWLQIQNLSQPEVWDASNPPAIGNDF